MRILIADDNPLLRRVLRATLEAHEGWTVCCEAADGVEAIEQAKCCVPDIILLDLAMPNANGIDAARTISQLRPGVPIVLFTLYASPALDVQAREAGVQRVISKSRPETLLPAIEEAWKQIQNRARRSSTEPTPNSGAEAATV